MANFLLYIPKVKAFEGGKVDHPKDPGGATNMGVTLNTWRLYGSDMDGDGDIDKDDLWMIDHSDAVEIFKQRYWDTIHGDQIRNQDVAEIIVDHAINAGPKRAVKMAQYILNRHFSKNLAEDGAMGPNTLGALNSVNPSKFYNEYHELRKQYYYFRANIMSEVPPYVRNFLDSMIDPSESAKEFIRGWIIRVEQFPKKKAIAGAVAFAVIGGITTVVVIARRKKNNQT